MQNTATMSRLSQLAERNRTSGFRVLFATAMMIAGAVLAAGFALTAVSSIL